MTDKEKLQEILDYQEFYALKGYEFSARGEPLKWLIEQAEQVDMLVHENINIRKGYQERSKQVQELEHNLNHGAKVAVKAAEKLHDAQQENKRLCEALEGALKAVEIYSGKPAKEAMEELIKLAEQSK